MFVAEIINPGTQRQLLIFFTREIRRQLLISRTFQHRLNVTLDIPFKYAAEKNRGGIGITACPMSIDDRYPEEGTQAPQTIRRKAGFYFTTHPDRAKLWRIVFETRLP